MGDVELIIDGESYAILHGAWDIHVSTVESFALQAGQDYSEEEISGIVTMLKSPKSGPLTVPGKHRMGYRLRKARDGNRKFKITTVVTC